MWNKVLWLHQGYADNYVPDSFLSLLKRNRDVKRYEYWRVVEDMSVLVLNLSLVQIFVASFVGIYTGKLNPSSACLFALGHSLLIALFWARRNAENSRLQSFKAVCLLTIIVRALSPVFLSLTRSTSSDSIWHVTAWLCLIYTGCASLPMAPNRHTRVMATNTALSATIVLASRLSTADQVFYFLMFNMQTFVLLPSAGLWIYRTSRFYYAFFLVTAWLAANALTWIYIDKRLAMACVAAQLCATFGIPRWFISIQKYKDQISGPWDPAKAVIDET